MDEQINKPIFFVSYKDITLKNVVKTVRGPLLISPNYTNYLVKMHAGR